MELDQHECVYVCVLGLRLLGGAVGEVLELLLVDLSDDGLVGGGQHRVLLGEVLVEVVHVTLGFLHTHTYTHTRGEVILTKALESNATATPGVSCG